jgi:hypothetical protein
MLTTIRGLPPDVTYRAFHQLKAQPYVHYREMPPGVPVAAGDSDSTGTLVLDLPTRTPLSLVGPDGRAITVNNATTVVTTL